MRRSSGPNPFSHGPSSGSGVVLSSHDMGGLHIPFYSHLIGLTIFLVPIYNARKVETDFYELIHDIDKLPRINCEVPADSCAVVAYTVNTWGRDTIINVSFNIKWVMVLGAPSTRR